MPMSDYIVSQLYTPQFNFSPKNTRGGNANKGKIIALSEHVPFYLPNKREVKKEEKDKDKQDSIFLTNQIF